MTISGSEQILFATSASSPGDYVRVLTAFSPGAAVPEPAPAVTLLFGLAAVVVLHRTRRRLGRWT